MRRHTLFPRQKVLIDILSFHIKLNLRFIQCIIYTMKIESLRTRYVTEMWWENEAFVGVNVGVVVSAVMPEVVCRTT